MNYDPVSRFAEPIKKKNKKGLHMSNWRELLSSDSSDSHTKDMDKSLPSNVVREKVKVENMEVSYEGSMPDNLSIARQMNVKSQSNGAESRLVSDMKREFTGSIDSMDLDLVTEPSYMASSIKDGVSMGHGKLDHASVSMDYECESANDVKSKTLSLVAPESEFDSLESQIDAENQARLQNMSPDEIAEAQAEIRDRINPKLLNLLKKRGKEKYSSTKTIPASSDETGLWGKKKIGHSPVLDSNNSPSSVSSAHQDTQRRLRVVSPHGGLWDAWSKRVEAARDLRFSLDGTVMQIDPLHSTNFGMPILEKSFLNKFHLSISC